MLTAVMIHPPLFGATLKSLNGSKAKAMKGVATSRQPHGASGRCDGHVEAMKAREAVTVEWRILRREAGF